MSYAARALRELNARFLKILDATTHQEVDALGEADGVMFLCPKCFEDPPLGPDGTHSIICWSPKVGQEHNPKPGRWNLVGSGLDDLELVAGSSSVQILDGCNAHFFVRAGRIVPS